MRLTTIGFDADDTLWQNEQFFRLTEDRFVELLENYADAANLKQHLLQAAMRNLNFYGFGIKSFTLSMIETALDVTAGKVPSSVIARIMEIGRDLLQHPIEPLPHAAETLEALAGGYRLLLITKGDLFDQERKLAQSGLGDFFDGVEIVSDKTSDTYARIFARYGDGPEKSAMVGNSLKSDIIPAIRAGAWGIFVPHELTWAFEHENPPVDEPRFRELAHLGDLSALLAQIQEGESLAG
ncbi:MULTISPECIES: HAD family hydrolase [Chelativorans]|jgi:putative hydrolase of the HAD superfamily|uniref:Haloacid dehalogenase-like hydrolase n=1 Tax=Chelativorans sp. (strain BNC1) TaxID=266779 RepID=Q11B34_CHESB|nr:MULTISPECIES: HAD family hydrolase [Chelativorans]